MIKHIKEFIFKLLGISQSKQALKDGEVIAESFKKGLGSE